MKDRDTLPRLRHNIAAMGMVQAVSYIVPLLTIPYLTRVLGIHAFGEVALAQIVATYIIFLTEYAFSWNTTRKISANRDDVAMASRIFFSAWVVQWALVVFAAALGLLAILTVPDPRADAAFLSLAFLTVIGNALFPVWFLQGLEQLRVVAILQIGIRLLTLVPLFAFVRGPNDGYLVLAISGAASILGGVLAVAWIRSQRLAVWCCPCWEDIRDELTEGASLFGSRLAVSSYTALVPLLLGWSAGPSAVAQFSVADKLRQAVQAVVGPVSQALYPRMSRLAATDSIAAASLLRTASLSVAAIAGAGSALLWLLADQLVVWMGGAEFSPAASLLRLLAPLPLVVNLSSLASVQVLLVNNKVSTFNAVLITCGIAGLPFMPFVTKSAQWSAMFILLMECVIMMLMVCFAARFLMGSRR